MAEAESGRVLHAADPDVQVVSASTIKVPILCAALELCRRGELSLSQLVPIPEDWICPDTSVFEEGNRQEAGYSCGAAVLDDRPQRQHRHQRRHPPVGIRRCERLVPGSRPGADQAGAGDAGLGTPSPPAGTTTPPRRTSAGCTGFCTGERS